MCGKWLCFDVRRVGGPRPKRRSITIFHTRFTQRCQGVATARTIRTDKPLTHRRRFLHLTKRAHVRHDYTYACRGKRKTHHLGNLSTDSGCAYLGAVYEADCPRTQSSNDATGLDCPGRGGKIPPDAIRPISARLLKSTQGDCRMIRAQRAHPDVVTEQCPVGAAINTCLTLTWHTASTP